MTPNIQRSWLRAARERAARSWTAAIGGLRFLPPLRRRGNAATFMPRDPHASNLLINLHVRNTVRPNPSAIHPFRVERRREVAFAVEDDRAAVAADRLQLLVDHLVTGLLHGHAFVLVQR